MQAHIRHHSVGGDRFLTESVECKEKYLWWQVKGLSYTSTGYGKRIPTTYMVKYNNKWRRVYCCVYSNIGKLYIGKISDGLVVTVSY